MNNITVGHISSYLEREIPPFMKEDYDNVGLLVGMEDCVVTRVLVVLDITEEVIEEARGTGAELIVSHHPLFFQCKKIRSSDALGRKVIGLIQSGISAVCMHTNLDASPWGVNTVLADLVGLEEVKLMEESGRDGDIPYGIPRYGTLRRPVEMDAFLSHIKSTLRTPLRYHNAGRTVSNVAVCGGSGGGLIHRAYELGCDTLVTSDIKYHAFLDAKELGMNIIDADHYATENPVCTTLRDKLAEAFPNVQVSVSKIHSQTVKFF